MVKTLLVSLSACAFFGLASTSLAQPTNLNSSAFYSHSAALKLIDDANDDSSDQSSSDDGSQDQSNSDDGSQDQSNSDDGSSDQSNDDSDSDDN